ncbi:hypothetical protein M493_15005 [Geobacillus genomosp. 3]|uniref:Uncharacterized protein n=1 Tax=Geobacillus genomosp. 3 TaxID=1921421 RepID=S5ZS35_GEOG3|nr:hypothetical protein M493_15005 [Geobacillus genomosp. 3]
MTRPNNSLDSEQELRRQRRDKRTVRQVELGVVALAGPDPVAQAFGERHAADGSVASIDIDEIAIRVFVIYADDRQSVARVSVVGD